MDEGLKLILATTISYLAGVLIGWLLREMTD